MISVCGRKDIHNAVEQHVINIRRSHHQHK